MKRAIVLYHGFITDDKDFGRLYDYLGERYDHVERCLFPGHGEPSDYSKFTVDATFDCLLETFDRVRAEYDRVDVIGFSMGGALSAYLATVRDFDNLVLLAPASVFLNPKLPFEITRFYFTKIKNALASGIGVEEKKKEMEEVLAPYLKNDMKSINMAIRRLLPNYNIKNVTTFASIVKRANRRLDEIYNPTLIIWGKLDQLVPESTVHFLMDKMKDKRSEARVFDDVSHLMLASENDQEIIDVILEFLDKRYQKELKPKEEFGVMKEFELGEIEQA